MARPGRTPRYLLPDCQQNVTLPARGVSKEVSRARDGPWASAWNPCWQAFQTMQGFCFSRFLVPFCNPDLKVLRCRTAKFQIIFRFEVGTYYQNKTNDEWQKFELPMLQVRGLPPWSKRNDEKTIWWILLKNTIINWMLGLLCVRHHKTDMFEKQRPVIHRGKAMPVIQFPKIYTHIYMQS